MRKNIVAGNWKMNKTLQEGIALAKELAKERKRQQQTQKPVSSQNNKFNNFDGRSYDMNDLERRLVQQ